MSRIGKLPVVIPAGLSINITDGLVKVKGPKGELDQAFRSEIVEVVQEENSLIVRLKQETEKAYYGLIRKLLSNIVEGVFAGFEKKLEINGVGYRAQVQGKKLTLSLGYSHPVEMEIPEGLTVEVQDNTKVSIKGADRAKVGQFAAEVRSKRPPEPYQGKGVKYADEIIRRKVGKTGA